VASSLQCNAHSPVIGVLDLQGGVQEHLDHLRRVGVEAKRVKERDDFAGLAGLILPGGESTCLGRLLRLFDLEQAIIDGHRNGLRLWGTCAGAILLARENIGEQPFLQLIDIAVQRNAFGSQLDSFVTEARVPAVSQNSLPLTFIRAPKIVQAGPGVQVLLRMEDYIAAAEDELTLVTVFHPELTPNLTFHRYFVRKCSGPAAVQVKTAADDESAWDRKSWMRFAQQSSKRSSPTHPRNS